MKTTYCKNSLLILYGCSLTLQAIIWIVHLAKVWQKMFNVKQLVVCGSLIMIKNWLRTLTDATIDYAWCITVLLILGCLNKIWTNLGFITPTPGWRGSYSVCSVQQLYMYLGLLIIVLFDIIFLFRFLLNFVGQQENLPDNSHTKWIQQYHRPLLPHCLLSSSTLEALSTSQSEDQM